MGRRLTTGPYCVCCVCNKQFMPYRRNPKGNENQCCSLKCFGISRRTSCRRVKGRKTVNCPVCGIQHEVSFSCAIGMCRKCVTRKAGIQSRIANPFIGPANPRWKGGISADVKAWLKNWSKQYRLKNPLRQKARDAVKYAISKGELIREDCRLCASSNDVQAHHHFGYEKENWLNVIWLCRTCHNKVHGKRGGLKEEEKENFSFIAKTG